MPQMDGVTLESKFAASSHDVRQLAISTSSATLTAGAWSPVDAGDGARLEYLHAPASAGGLSLSRLPADINRDGHGDVIIGDPVAGEVYIFLGGEVGGRGLATGKANFTISHSGLTGVGFGAEVHVAYFSTFEVLSSSLPDVIITTETGNQVWVVPGRALTTPALDLASPGSLALSFTYSSNTVDLAQASDKGLAFADVNGDGLADMVTNGGLPGEVLLVFGRLFYARTAVDLQAEQSSGALGTISLAGAGATAQRPASITTGDFNADGFPDIALGLPHSTDLPGQAAGTGAVVVVFHAYLPGAGETFTVMSIASSAATSLAVLSDGPGLILSIQSANRQCGSSLAALPSPMGGSSLAIACRLNTPTVFVFTLTKLGSDGSVLPAASASLASDTDPEWLELAAFVGYSLPTSYHTGVAALTVAHAGDFDVDGLPDLWVGAQGASGAGAAFLLLGRTPAETAEDTFQDTGIVTLVGSGNAGLGSSVGVATGFYPAASTTLVTCPSRGDTCFLLEGKQVNIPTSAVQWEGGVSVVPVDTAGAPGAPITLEVWDPNFRSVSEIPQLNLRALGGDTALNEGGRLRSALVDVVTSSTWLEYGRAKFQFTVAAFPFLDVAAAIGRDSDPLNVNVAVSTVEGGLVSTPFSSFRIAAARPTPTATPSPSNTPVSTPTSSVSPSPSQSAAPTPSRSPSTSASETASPSSLPTTSSSASVTPSASVSPTTSSTVSMSPTATQTPTATQSPSASPTADVTRTPEPTSSPTVTPSATASQTATASASAPPTFKPNTTPTATPTPSNLRKAPRLEGAVFQRTGARFDVTFRDATDRAQRTGAFDCLQLLTVSSLGSGAPASLDLASSVVHDQAAAAGLSTGAYVLQQMLGQGASCAWASPSKLTVSFGFGASLPVGQPLDIRPGRILRAGGYSRAASGTVTVAAPADAVSPAPALSFPQTLGQCDDLALDASLSTGGAGRGLTFTWSLASTTASAGPDLDDLNSALADATASSAERLVVPRNLLQSGAVYTFDVSVENFFGRSSSLAGQGQLATVEVFSAALPTVDIAGGLFKTTVRSKALTLQASGFAPACDPTNVVPLTYTWSQLSGPSTVQLSSLPDPRAVRIPAGQMSGVSGSPFVFQVAVTVTGSDPPVTSTASVSVAIQPADLVAFVSGGDRTVGITRPLTVSAADSFDPDVQPNDSGDTGIPAGASQAYTFTWTCSASGQSCSDLLSTATFTDDGATFTVSAESLTAYRASNVEFEVSVTSTVSLGGSPTSTKQASAGATITVLDAALPEVGVEAPADAGVVSTALGVAFKVDTTKRQIMTGSATFSAEGTEQAPVLVYEWSLLEGDLDMGRPELNFGTPLNQPTVSVRQGVLTPGSVYTFQLSAWPQGNTLLVGTSTVTLLANRPPSSGTLEVSPSSGVALQDQFTLRAIRWVDDPEDQPFTYEFWVDEAGAEPSPAQLTAQSIGSPLATGSEQNTLRVTLPQGAAPDYLVTLIVYVKDALGTTATKWTQVRSNPPVADDASDEEVTSFVTGKASAADRALAEGNGAGAISTVSALGSLLNEDARRRRRRLVEAGTSDTGAPSNTTLSLPRRWEYRSMC